MVDTHNCSVFGGNFWRKSSWGKAQKIGNQLKKLWYPLRTVWRVEWVIGWMEFLGPRKRRSGV